MFKCIVLFLGLLGISACATLNSVTNTDEKVLAERPKTRFDSIKEDPRILQSVFPEYPKDALAEAVTGFVKFQFQLTVDGYVTDLKIIESQPSKVFDKAATIAFE